MSSCDLWPSSCRLTLHCITPSLLKVQASLKRTVPVRRGQCECRLWVVVCTVLPFLPFFSPRLLRLNDLTPPSHAAQPCHTMSDIRVWSREKETLCRRHTRSDRLLSRAGGGFSLSLPLSLALSLFRFIQVSVPLALALALALAISSSSPALSHSLALFLALYSSSSLA